MADVNLSKAVRSNLLSLQSTAASMSKTQNRLATGLRVNSALDNPSNFFTASALKSRAGDMANLMDSMASGIQTIEAADNGLKSITKTVESMQSTLRQARQDKSFETLSSDVSANLTNGEFATGSAITFRGGSTGVAIDGTAISVSIADMTVDEAVAAINAETVEGGDLEGAVRASNDNGKLRIENISTSDLEIGGTTSVTTATIGGNEVRKNLVTQFNDLRDQLDKFADDASFNGINLLRGDKLKLTFNETGTSTIEIQAKDGEAINNASLEIDAATDADFDLDATLDTKLDGLKSALDSLRSQASTFGSNLSVVENRQDFTKNMINTLETGAANLTLADTNEEAANLLALQTRQQLSSTALSMASQADQAVLRLF